ncbi:MAG: HD domain-containing protein [Thermodesulfobacteriota bacterium]
MKRLIKDARTYSISCADGARGSHDWEHTRRVHALCLQIGRKEGADLLVLELASYLHDIGRSAQDHAKGGICHAELGAAMALEFLKDRLPAGDLLDNVIHCVRTHRFRGNTRPESLEARVLFDADKLDAIGAVGIGRAFQFAGEVGATLHNPFADLDKTASYTREDTAYREYRLKLSRIRERILTKEGRRLAEERHAFMELFFERFLEEVTGKR